VTYEMMARYWPTPAARQANAAVAEGMNAMPKVVFSRTLGKASWSNTTVVKGDPATEVRKMKGEPGPDMVVLGSGTIVSQLAGAGLIDDLQIVVVPVILGKGRTLFEGVEKTIGLERVKSRNFGNGNVVLWYQPRG
jgi:dihydrofolate reductase